MSAKPSRQYAVLAERFRRGDEALALAELSQLWAYALAEGNTRLAREVSAKVFEQIHPEWGVEKRDAAFVAAVLEVARDETGHYVLDKASRQVGLDRLNAVLALDRIIDRLRSAVAS
jgi:hypothetical protein